MHSTTDLCLFHVICPTFIVVSQECIVHIFCSSTFISLQVVFCWVVLNDVQDKHGCGYGAVLIGHAEVCSWRRWMLLLVKTIAAIATRNKMSYCQSYFFLFQMICLFLQLMDKQFMLAIISLPFNSIKWYPQLFGWLECETSNFAIHFTKFMFPIIFHVSSPIKIIKTQWLHPKKGALLRPAHKCHHAIISSSLLFPILSEACAWGNKKKWVAQNFGFLEGRFCRQRSYHQLLMAPLCWIITYVLGSKLPLVPCSWRWSSTQ